MDNFFPCTPVFFWIFFIGVAIVISIVSRQNSEKQKAAWQRLAAAHNLSFISNDSFFGNGAYITGLYRGYPLKLETIQKSQGKSSVLYTRIEVFVSQRHKDSHPTSQPEQSLSFQGALSRFTSPGFRYPLSGEFKAEPGGQPIYYEQRDIVQDTQFLTNLFDLLTNLAEAYPVVVALGGEAIPALQPALENKTFGEVALQLLRDVAQENSRRLAYRAPHLLCPRCLTRFGPHELRLSWWNIYTYYGCRTCGQSREFLEGSVISVLDSQMTAAPAQQEGIVRVNWSAHHELFDFDAVEIAQATDEEVERFAVQTGNDTDPIRRPRYKEMQCVILSGCQLSENTLRILQRMFGQVVSGNEGNWRSKEI